MDISSLVSETVKQLAPALPLLHEGVRKAVESAGEAVGKGATETAGKIWHWLKPQADAHPALREAAEEVAAHPADADAQAVLRRQLRKVLEAQPQLVPELAGIVGKVRIDQKIAQAGGAGAVATVGDMKNVTITTNVTK